MHELRVRAIDSTGAAVWSEVKTTSVAPPEPSVQVPATTHLTGGNWQGNVGSDGHVIAAHATNLPFYAEIAITNETLLWQETSAEDRALERVDSNERIASAWEASETFTIEIALRYGQFRRVSFYFLDWDGANQRSQIIEVLDNNDVVLYTHTITNFSEGEYLAFRLRGHVKIRITATGLPSAVLSGVFFDTESNDAPTVSIMEPGDGISFSLPRDIVIEANASDSDGNISKVEFFANGTKLGELTNAPYHFAWTNAFAGTYSVTARAVDDLNAIALSESVRITATAPLANAVFLQPDEITQGNWRGNYGSDGYVAVNHATNLPPFFHLGSEMPGNYTWANSISDVRALQHVEGDGRIAATWVETESLSLDFQLLDGKNYRIAFYFLDWERSGRSLEATFFDAVTGHVLDTQQITNIGEGNYYVWNLRGHVKVSIKRASGANAVLSGIFIDSYANPPPTIRLTSPKPETDVTVPQQLLLSVDVFDDEAVSKVEYFANGKRIGESIHPPFEFVWQTVAGNHSLVAKAIDNEGAASDSDSVQFSVQSNSSSAQFLGTDFVTQGDWKDAYGTLGYHIISESENYPPFAEVTISGNRDFTWNNSTVDVRAPRKALSPGRIASCWVSHTNFLIDLLIGNGIPHKVSFYCMDWDRGGRSQTFTIRDAKTGEILDTRILNQFQEGKYLSWSLNGHVTVELSANSINAVVSSLYFDPIFTPVELWRWLQFTTEELTDPNFSGDAADPDGDGIFNLLEYAHGLNPLAPETEPLLRAELADDSVQIIFYRAKAATDLAFNLEASDDLITWQSVEGILDYEEVIGASTIQVRRRLPIGHASHQFLRLRIQRPE